MGSSPTPGIIFSNMTTLKRSAFAIAALLMILGGVALFYGLLRHDPQAGSYSNSDSGKSMFLRQVDIRLDVSERGSLTVSEELEYDLGSVDWRGLYQDIILANGESVEGVSVTRLDNGVRAPLAPGSGIELGVGGEYGSFGYGVIKDPDRRLRIVWNVRDSGVHRFSVRYKLGGAVKNYSDASTLLWDVWGAGWETGVGQLTAVANFPGRVKLFEPRAGDLQRRIVQEASRGSGGYFRMLNIPARRQVQLRAAAQPLTGMPRRQAEIMPTLRKEQAEIDAHNAAQAKESAELLNRSFLWFVIKALIGALICCIFVFVCWRWLGRDTTKFTPAGGSYQYPPEKIPPPVIAKALGGAETDKLVSATILGFMQRDVFRVLPSATKKEDISIRNLVGETTFDRSKVQDYELPIAELLQSAIDKHDEHSPDFSKLKKSLDAKTAETQIALFDKNLKAQYPAFGLKSTYRGRVRRWVLGLLGLGIYLLGLLACFSDGGNAAARYEDMSFALYLIGFGPVLLWAAIEGNAFYTLKADQADRVRKWETYKDFFAKMDMSREYPLTVEIWDEALLYAAAFGYAKKVITNMPRTDAQGNALTTSDTVGLGWMSGNAWAASSFGNISSGISGVTGMASSSSSGGGGFSGGGSGGGGGGGW